MLRFSIPRPAIPVNHAANHHPKCAPSSKSPVVPSPSINTRFFGLTVASPARIRAIDRETKPPPLQTLSLSIVVTLGAIFLPGALRLSGLRLKPVKQIRLHRIDSMTTSPLRVCNDQRMPLSSSRKRLPQPNTDHEVQHTAHTTQSAHASFSTLSSKRSLELDPYDVRVRILLNENIKENRNHPRHDANHTTRWLADLGGYTGRSSGGPRIHHHPS